MTTPKYNDKQAIIRSFVQDLLGRDSLSVTSNDSKFGDIKSNISLGLVDGIEIRRVRGFVNDVDSNKSSDVIFQSGLYPYLLTAENISVTSDDTETGTVEITGLLGDYSEDIEVVSVGSITTKKFLRIQFVRMLGAPNVGTITLTSTATSKIQTVIGFDAANIPLRTSFNAIQTIPLGKIGLLAHSFGSITRRGGSSGVKEGVLSLSTKKISDDMFYIGPITTTRSDGSSFILIGNDYPTLLEEKEDVKAEVISFTGNSHFSINMTIILIDKATFGLD